ncbi:hypothetical protein [Ottowia sp.]|uniref:hypothetical protein n=1 Tax=Ottowia sp. TaxID=1898956 RepID=UPI002C03E638|nr:hypothetical protein [Ottowia sp.]HOB66675.1 hypothetical protein [Ottowia sp.]HPZ57572.1 hypothetical protein [Ottowia sp.]HQD47064.1 hypothetical protein [Ottowia sp.]
MALNLTEDELQLLAALPQSIGSAVAFAGRSGLFGTGKEMFASGQALMAGVKDYPGNELIQAIVPDPSAADKAAELDQARKTRDWAMARLKAKGITSAEKLTAQTLDDAREVAQLLASKVDPAQAAQYRQWALGVAEKVAMASTEGGFLGFGGTRLSDDEKKLIAELRGALGA